MAGKERGGRPWRLSTRNSAEAIPPIQVVKDWTFPNECPRGASKGLIDDDYGELKSDRSAFVQEDMGCSVQV
jgi:hypothetical protein